ncbi:MAG TPA: hypothetical protein VJZ72_00080 [Candidatus Limnocylindrales bacterium]|nr:hypothetical protein [Candidatus Limnocylindrales bacterium]
MDPNEKCRCGHERAWHDACSRCPCPFFLVKGAPSAIVRRWRRERAIRELREVRA